MTKSAADPHAPFPCPFCRASRVVLIGGGLVFLHYQCAECSEVWTAMGQPGGGYAARRVAADSYPQAQSALSPDTKHWRH